jgi:hypothetical protein
VRRFERRTAPARTRRIRIDDSKTGAGQTAGKIQGRALQVRDALVIDKKLHAIALDYGVTVLLFAKRHLVVQTGTPAFDHFDSQTLLFRSLGKQTLKLPNCVVGDVNHRLEKYGGGVSKSKPACELPDCDQVPEKVSTWESALAVPS